MKLPLMMQQKIVGCWKALSKYGIMDELGDEEPMKRAVAFAKLLKKITKAKPIKLVPKILLKFLVMWSMLIKNKK